MLKQLAKNIHPRSMRQYKNIALSFLYKGVAMLSSFILLPISLNFLSSETFGVWLTLSSILGWISFFDLGLGNGLRNKLSDAIVSNDNTVSKKLVSTSYVSLTVLVGGIYLLLTIASIFIDYNDLFRVNNKKLHINLLVHICLFIFLVKLVLDLLNSILFAYQKVSLVNLMGAISNLLTTLFVFCATQIEIPVNERLLVLAIIISSSPLLVTIIFTYTQFNSKLAAIKPSIVWFDKTYIWQIALLGSKFFFLQLATLIIFSTDNIIIARLFDTTEVTVFNIAYKIFSVFLIVWTIIITPYWTAFGDAFGNKDFIWVKKTINTLLLFWISLSIIIILLVPFVNDIVKLWINKDIRIKTSLSVSLAVFIIIVTYNLILSNFLNGVGKIKIQLYLSGFMAIINVPLSIFFSSHMDFGLSGVVIGNCITLGFSTVINTIKVYNLVYQNTADVFNNQNMLGST